MNARRRPLISTTTALAGATALGVLSLSACGNGTASGRADGKLDIVASFYPTAFLAERIGGEHVSVNSLTAAGVEPHDLELSPKQTAQVGEAGLVVYLKGLQPAVDEAIKQSGARNTAEATSFTDPERHGAETDGHGDETDGHDGEVADPHIWLDPVKYAEVAEGVGRAMEKADPDNAADYRKNTKALVAELGKLDNDFRSGLKNRKNDTFITAHAAFGHLADRYGLQEEAISGLDPDSEPSGARMKALHKVAQEEKIDTVFFETLASDRTVRTLAEDRGLKTDVLDPVEGITDRSKGADYFEVMHANLKALQKALGAQ